MKKQKTKKQNTNKGITLIALVITIIVMLILVAVTITMAINGGLFEYARNAGTQTNEATANEQLLASGQVTIGGTTYESIDEYINNNPITTATIEKGAFVEYGVAYIDTYIAKEYSTTNGWRLLDYTPNDDGTIKNVKLISTGIPAKLYYCYNDTTNSSWYVTTDADLTAFKNVLGGENNYMFYTGDYRYYSLQASAGMYNNFGYIKFVYGTDKNEKSKGFYTSITANGTTYNSSTTAEKTGNDLFKVGNNVEKVRLLTLKELNEGVGRKKFDTTTQISETEDSMGLFRLNNLSSVMSGYDYSSSGSCFLASPTPNTVYYDTVSTVLFNGNLNSSQYKGVSGVRPVIVMNSNVAFSASAVSDEKMNVSYLKLTPVL